MHVDYFSLESEKDLTKFKELQSIINANLFSNGGTLRQGNLLEKNYLWTHLFLLRDENNTVGFGLLRLSEYDQHDCGYDRYYYISDIVLLPEYHNKGYGTMLLDSIINTVSELPIVSSVRKDNPVSINLFNKFMELYADTGKYYRFISKKLEIKKD